MVILGTPLKLFLIVVMLSMLTVSTAPGELAAISSVQQTFIIPSTGNNTYNGFSSTHNGHNGVDIQSYDRPQISNPYDPNNPTAEDLRCLAEPGSVDDLGQPITRGDYNPSDGLNRCDDWQGAVVWAASSGLVTFVGLAFNNTTHIVRIDHGTLADGTGRRVETEYLHLGTKVRDGRYPDIGDPRRSFITVGVNIGESMDIPVCDE